MKKYVILLFTLFLVPQVFADKKPEALLNKLFAPGPLIMGHKKIEATGCLDCHDAGKGVPDNKCLTCHKEIRPYVEEKRGFHGRLSEKCISCHTDHKGRDLDTTKVDLDSFDHSRTGYKLEGEHSTLKCSKCHVETRKNKEVRKGDIHFLGLATSCKKCHEDDDVHRFRGRFSRVDCNKCHGSMDWKKDVQFDHKRDTDYVLKGAHRKIKCNDCHNVSKDKRKPKFVYKWLELQKQKCLTCHSDHHGKKLGPRYRSGNCTQCHSETTWKIEKFDHSITRFELRGQHTKTKCTDCHKQSKGIAQKNFNWSGLKTQCNSCHTDVHSFGQLKSKKLGLLTNCSTCHSETSWEKTHRFNHNKDTRYPITGKHLEVSCSKCHTPVRKSGKKVTQRRYHWKQLLSKTCENCHESPHTKKFSPKFLKKKCTECHVSSGWEKKPFKGDNFNHNETRFKLTGAHAKVKCGDCHVINDNQVFQFKSFRKQFCIDCHDSPHLNQFRKETNQKSCAECHNTKTFRKLNSFNHDETEFPLKGAHKKQRCFDCHMRISPLVTSAEKKPKHSHKFVFNNLKQDNCRTCHNDFHDGQLSEKCSQCHNEKTWKKTSFNHNKDSDFSLLGKHSKVKCSKCHELDRTRRVKFGKPAKTVRVRIYKMEKDSCYSCHKKDDEHKGQYGNDCQQCHSEKDWKKTKDFHRDFTLHGAHFTVECSECHIDNRKLSGMSDNCLHCHQKDDIHSGNLPQCQSCHVQQFWEHSKFRHSMTFFPLRGVHRTLDCFECHAQNRYEGTPSECIVCHEAERVTADAASGTPHPLPTVNECNACHNQFSWPGATP